MKNEDRNTLWRRFDRACFATKEDRTRMRRFIMALLGWMLAFVAARSILPDADLLLAGRVVLAVSPTLLGFVSLAYFAAYLRNADELARRIHYEAFAVGFGAGGLLMTGYPLVETLGLPPMDLPSAFGLMAIVWALAVVANAQRYA